jgi:hypothetical protein
MNEPLGEKIVKNIVQLGGNWFTIPILVLSISNGDV